MQILANFSYQTFIFTHFPITLRKTKFRFIGTLNKLEKEVDSEVIKAKRGHKKKTDTKTLPKINEEEGNDIRDKRDRLKSVSKVLLPRL